MQRCRAPVLFGDRGERPRGARFGIDATNSSKPSVARRARPRGSRSVALVRAGAHVRAGQLVEHPDEPAPPAAAGTLLTHRF